MASGFTLENVINDVTPATNRLMTGFINEYVDDDYYTWPMRLFHTETRDLIKERFRSVPEIESWDEWNENESTKLLSIARSEEIEARATVFKKGFLVTDMYMRYARSRPEIVTAVLEDLREFSGRFVEAGLRLMPEMAAGVFLNAFSSASQPMPDGSALVANSHTDVAGDNLETVKLSPELLDNFQAMRVYVDTEGRPHMYNWDTIVIGPDNEANLDEILGAQAKPGGNDNNANPYAGRFKNKIVLPWLDNSVQSGASEYVFVLDSRKHNLYGRIIEMPHYQPPFQKEPETYLYEGREIFTFFALNNAGIAGSDGSTDPT